MARTPLINIDALLQLGLEDLKRLWDDIPWIYRDALARHPRTPSALLWHAVKTDHSHPWLWRLGWVRSGLAEDLAWSMIFSIADRNHYRAHNNITCNRSVTEEMLLVLTELAEDHSRYRLLDHANTTIELLQRLSHDPYRHIRRDAVRRLRAKRKER